MTESNLPHRHRAVGKKKSRVLPKIAVLNREAASFSVKSALLRFFGGESASGLFLLLAAAVALWLSNSSYHHFYESFFHKSHTVGVGAWQISVNMHFLVNEVLMTFFFLAVGVEIRQELYNGALSQWQQAALPLFAAFGGVCLPALIYLSFNYWGSTIHGWAVPTATDIAFALGVLALLGKSVPANLRIILLSLAVIDDIIAVLIIAFFYSGGLSFSGACITAGAVACILVLQYLGFRNLFFYLLAGVLCWVGLWKMGVHPSLAGVLLGLLTPVLPLSRSDSSQKHPRSVSPAQYVQEALHFWVAFVIMPLFAFINAGIRLSDLSFAVPSSISVMFGIICGLVFGKPLGVLLATFLAIKSRLCRLPPHVSPNGMILVGLLAGIGFTMAIFVSMLAFPDKAENSVAVLGVLCGSAISALFGLCYGFVYCRCLRQNTG